MVVLQGRGAHLTPAILDQEVGRLLVMGRDVELILEYSPLIHPCYKCSKKIYLAIISHYRGLSEPYIGLEQYHQNNLIQNLAKM